MEPIKGTIQDLLREWRRRAEKQGEPERWLKKILTKKELAHIKFNYFRRGVLGLSVDSSGLLYQLSLKKEELVGKLKEEARGVKDIRLRIGVRDEKG